MTPPRLIAIDMDGTLLHSNGTVTPRTLAALRLGASHGAEVVIATGRRHCYAMRVLGALALPQTNALISSNGAVIRTINHELLHRHEMPLATARWLCSHVGDFRSTLVITFDTVGPDGADTRGSLVVEDLAELRASIGRWIDSNDQYIAHVTPIENALTGDPPIQMMLCGPVARMAAAEARLLEHPRVTPVGSPDVPGAEITLHRTAYPERDLSIVDILPAGCSKASALTHLAALRNIPLAQTLAIGDNWNDLPMLERAGHAVLMSNAPAELHTLARQRHWHIAPTNDEDGVAQTLEHLFQSPCHTLPKPQP